MRPEVKQFIETYIKSIEQDDLEFVFTQAADKLSNDDISELSKILESVDIPTEEVRWKVYDQRIVQYIQDYLAAPSWTKDKSNSWARVDYAVAEIATNLGFGQQRAKQHVIANGSKYGTTVRKLAPEYGWQGSGDYAFDWFNSIEFEKEYLDD